MSSTRVKGHSLRVHSWRLNMEPPKWRFDSNYVPFQLDDFEVPCQFFQVFFSFPRLPWPPWCQEVVNKAEEKATTEETKKRLREVEWVKTIGLVGVRFGWGEWSIYPRHMLVGWGDTPKFYVGVLFFCQLMVNCWFGAKWFEFLGPKGCPFWKGPVVIRFGVPRLNPRQASN